MNDLATARYSIQRCLKAKFSLELGHTPISAFGRVLTYWFLKFMSNERRLSKADVIQVQNSAMFMAGVGQRRLIEIIRAAWH